MMSNCKNCGAPIHNGKCEYCGTEYPVEIPVHIVDKLAWWELRLFTVADFRVDMTKELRLKCRCSNCGSVLQICLRFNEYELPEFWFPERIKGFTMTEKLDFCENCAARMTHVEFNPSAYGNLEKPFCYLIPHIINDIPFGTRNLRMRLICE